MTVPLNNKKSSAPVPDNAPPVKDNSSDKSVKKKYEQTIFLDWCKACGICVAFCPKNVFSRGHDGKPVIDKPENCIGCRFCELHCPDFAISIGEKMKFRRRKTDV